jgi:hypothetical protein
VTWNICRLFSEGTCHGDNSYFVVSIPDEKIGFFNSLHPSSRIMILGLAEPLTEMNTRFLPKRL